MAGKLLSFPQSIQNTQALINKIENEELSEAEIQDEVSIIVSTKSGARGFFVGYLTSDLALPDCPSPGIISGLKSSLEITSQLLVKNLAMSSAMVLAHQRNNDFDNVRASQRVSQRTKNLIAKMNENTIFKELEKLNNTILAGAGEYQDFLERWQYDEKQKQEIERAVSSIFNEGVASSKDNPIVNEKQ